MQFKFKEDAEGVASSDPHYDLFDGGYIQPDSLLDDPEQVAQVKDAVKTVRRFLEQAEEAGILELI